MGRFNCSGHVDGSAMMVTLTNTRRCVDSRLNMRVQADNTERVISKIRALLKRPGTIKTSLTSKRRLLSHRRRRGQADGLHNPKHMWW